MEKVEGRRKNKKQGNRDSEARQRVREIERRDYPRHADADARRRESTQTQYGLPHADAAIITLSCRRRPREPHLAAAGGCSSLHRYLIYDPFLVSFNT